MQTEISTLLQELGKKQNSLREELGNYMQPKIGTVLTEIPSPFGTIVRWKAEKSSEKRIVLDLYATGKVVLCLQEKLSENQEKFHETFGSFAEPDMKPHETNYFDLHNKGHLDELIKAIQNHFNQGT